MPVEARFQAITPSSPHGQTSDQRIFILSVCPHRKSTTLRICQLACEIDSMMQDCLIQHPLYFSLVLPSDLMVQYFSASINTLRFLHNCISPSTSRTRFKSLDFSRSSTAYFELYGIRSHALTTRGVSTRLDDLFRFVLDRRRTPHLSLSPLSHSHNSHFSTFRMIRSSPSVTPSPVSGHSFVSSSSSEEDTETHHSSKDGCVVVGMNVAIAEST